MRYWQAVQMLLRHSQWQPVPLPLYTHTIAWQGWGSDYQENCCPVSSGWKTFILFWLYKDNMKGSQTLAEFNCRPLIPFGWLKMNTFNKMIFLTHQSWISNQSLLKNLNFTNKVKAKKKTFFFLYYKESYLVQHWNCVRCSGTMT